MEGEKLVPAAEVLKRFPMPRYALYRMVKDGRVPAHVEPVDPQLWHKGKHKRYLFYISEVEAALRVLRESR